MTPLGPAIAIPLVILFVVILLLLNALIFRAAYPWGVNEPAIPVAAGIVLVAGLVGTVVDMGLAAGLGPAADLVGTLVLRVAINAAVTAAIYTALSEDVDYFTAILIYLGQLLVTGLAVGIVVASLVGFTAVSESRFLVAVPVIVALLALLAGAALFFWWRQYPRRRSHTGESIELVDFEVMPKSSGGLRAELKAAQGRLARIEAVEAENERLKAQRRRVDEAPHRQGCPHRRGDRRPDRIPLGSGGAHRRSPGRAGMIGGTTYRPRMHRNRMQCRLYLLLHPSAYWILALAEESRRSRARP